MRRVVIEHLWRSFSWNGSVPGDMEDEVEWLYCPTVLLSIVEHCRESVAVLNTYSEHIDLALVSASHRSCKRSLR
jgi:hypothetical protein